MPHAIYIFFAFVFGACVGSFLNVVVYRLPNAQTWWEGFKRLWHPPSHCPRCDTELSWKDNIPVFGWILLRGQCRYCHAPISPRYPIVEAVTGLLFVFYYVALFMLGWGPCQPPPAAELELGILAEARPLEITAHWPIYALYLFTIASLLAASLIDADLFIIPLEIPWTMAIVGIAAHAFLAQDAIPGNLIAAPLTAAVGAGGTIGLAISIIAMLLGRLPRSFPRGEPVLDADRPAIEKEMEELKRQGKPAPELPLPYTSGQVRAEMGKEVLFLLPPALGAGLMAWLTSSGGPMDVAWREWLETPWLAGVLGSLNGALIGALVVWLTRILGTLAFGRVAMGLGDVHLMFGVGAIIGGAAATIAFFVAPFFGLVLALWMLITRRGRELPYGPYLSLGTAFVMLFYCPIAEYLRGGLEGMLFVLGGGQ